MPKWVEGAGMPLKDQMRREPAVGGFVAGSNVALITSGLLLATTFVVSAWVLPAQLVLPTVCLAALTTAFAVGVVAWRSRAHDLRHPTYWDIAGALTFIAMCAAILSEPDQTLTLLEVYPRNR
jgi:Flp pilus assembly protein TadB